VRYIYYIFIASLLYGCQNRTYYFDCVGKERSVFKSLSTNKEDVSRSIFIDAKAHIFLKDTIFEYKLDGVSCKKLGDNLIQCGEITCHEAFLGTSKTDRCKKESWVYSSFNLISGDFYQRIYFPYIDKDEYSDDSYSLQCTKVKNALDD
jgi:hypothetical protein